MTNIVKEIIASVLIALEGMMAVASIYGTYDYSTDADMKTAAFFLILCSAVMIYANVMYILTLHRQNAAREKQASAEIIQKQRHRHRQEELDDEMAEEIQEAKIPPEEYSSLLTSQAKQDAGKEQDQ